MTSDDIREMFVSAYDDSRIEKLKADREELLAALAQLTRKMGVQERKRLIDEL